MTWNPLRAKHSTPHLSHLHLVLIRLIFEHEMSEVLNDELLEGGDTDCEPSSRNYVADEFLQCRSSGYDSSYTKLYYTSYSVLPKAVIRSSQESENSDRHDFSTIDEASQAQQQLGEFCQTAPFHF